MALVTDFLQVERAIASDVNEKEIIVIKENLRVNEYVKYEANLKVKKS